jgi:hypothetical protein
MESAILSLENKLADVLKARMPPKKRVGKLSSNHPGVAALTQHHRAMHPAARVMSEHLGMKPGARQFLAACVDGSQCDNHSVYVPVGSHPTQKVTVFGSIDSIGVSTGGSGFVAMTPNISAGDHVQYSTGNTYAPTVAQIGTLLKTTTATTGVTGLPLTLPYNLAVLNQTQGTSASNQYRLVNVTCKLRYTGSELNRGGIVYAMRHPRSQDLSNTFATTLKAEYPSIVKYNINSAEVFELVWFPVMKPQLELYDTAQANLPFNSYYPALFGNIATSFWDYTDAGLGSSGASFGYVIVGAQPSATFELQFWEHWEFMGKAPALLVTPSPPDEHGLSMAHHIIQHVDRSHADAPHIDRVGHTVDAIGKAVSDHGGEISAIAGSILGPEAGAGVAKGLDFYSKHQKPINTVISKGYHAIRDIFHF